MYRSVFFSFWKTARSMDSAFQINRTSKNEIILLLSSSYVNLMLSWYAFRTDSVLYNLFSPSTAYRQHTFPIEQMSLSVLVLLSSQALPWRFQQLQDKKTNPWQYVPAVGSIFLQMLNEHFLYTVREERSSLFLVCLSVPVFLHKFFKG